jgi:hypothetical protein
MGTTIMGAAAVSLDGFITDDNDERRSEGLRAGRPLPRDPESSINGSILTAN